jgi:hypothetical protein
MPVRLRISQASEGGEADLDFAVRWVHGYVGALFDASSRGQDENGLRKMPKNAQTPDYGNASETICPPCNVRAMYCLPLFM